MVSYSSCDQCVVKIEKNSWNWQLIVYFSFRHCLNDVLHSFVQYYGIGRSICFVRHRIFLCLLSVVCVTLLAFESREFVSRVGDDRIRWRKRGGRGQDLCRRNRNFNHSATVLQVHKVTSLPYAILCLGSIKTQQKIHLFI